MPPFLAFASLDRKSVRYTIPLSTIRRVERLNARAGIYALSLLTWHGLKLVVQLTSLRPTADLFCSLLKDALKVELQKGQMKQVKSFVKTCYSEVLVNGSSTAPENEREDGSLDDQVPTSEEITYHGGLGLKFKFPGDPKKYVLRSPRESNKSHCAIIRLRETSKIKLWTTYLKSQSEEYIFPVHT
jgi:hypothetical protein